jgi:hypothetical protein
MPSILLTQGLKITEELIAQSEIFSPIVDGNPMSGRTDLFSRYSQIYQKGRAREIVPEGPFVRQLTDVSRQGLDIGIFFKAKKRKTPVQVYLGGPIPTEVVEEEGFLETEESTYLSRTLLKSFKTLQYLRVVISAGDILEKKSERVEFLKRCQRIIDVLLRKAKNVAHLGSFEPFRFDKRVHTLSTLLKKNLKMDDVSIEAAMIPFNLADPDYIILSGNEIVVIGDEPHIQHGEFFFVCGIGYTFDKEVGAISEQRIFKSTVDFSSQGIDAAYIETMISQVNEDFQNNLHSILFSDLWKKGETKPLGVCFDENLLIKAEPSSEIWTGVFEVYVKPPVKKA